MTCLPASGREEINELRHNLLKFIHFIFGVIERRPHKPQEEEERQQRRRERQQQQQAFQRECIQIRGRRWSCLDPINWYQRRSLREPHKAGELAACLATLARWPPRPTPIACEAECRRRPTLDTMHKSGSLDEQRSPAPLEPLPSNWPLASAPPLGWSNGAHMFAR